jgi:DNA-binding protein H-NS
VSQNDKASKQAGSSFTFNKIFKSQESKGKTKLVEETSKIALEEKGHKTKTVRKEKNSSKNKSEQSIEQSHVTIPQIEKKKRKSMSTLDPIHPCKRPQGAWKSKENQFSVLIHMKIQ